MVNFDTSSLIAQAAPVSVRYLVLFSHHTVTEESECFNFIFKFYSQTMAHTLPLGAELVEHTVRTFMLFVHVHSSTILN